MESVTIERIAFSKTKEPRFRTSMVAQMSEYLDIATWTKEWNAVILNGGVRLKVEICVYLGELLLRVEPVKG